MKAGHGLSYFLPIGPQCVTRDTSCVWAEGGERREPLCVLFLIKNRGRAHSAHAHTQPFLNGSRSSKLQARSSKQKKNISTSLMRRRRLTEMHELHAQTAARIEQLTITAQLKSSRQAEHLGGREVHGPIALQRQLLKKGHL